MLSWCQNRLEITGKSVCLDVMQPWIAGILKPVRAVDYAPYPMLTASGTGAQTSPDQAFQHFIELLEQDAWLDTKTLSRMEKITLQSGIDALRLEAIPFSARQIMAQLMVVHYADWFDVAGAGGQFDPQERREWLSIMLETTCPCDMQMVMPSRLTTELNGDTALAMNKALSIIMQNAS